MVYLLHFAEPISLAHTTQHYLGYADDVQARLSEHRAGRGARLTQVALERGIDFDIVATWEGGRDFERYLKQRKAGPRLCPICGRVHRRGRLHIVRQYDQLTLFEDWPEAPATAAMDWYELSMRRNWAAARAQRMMAAMSGPVRTGPDEIPW